MQHSSIDSNQRTELYPGVCKLINVASDDDRKHIYTLLDPTGKMIFKELYERYSRDWKFTGKT